MVTDKPSRTQRGPGQALQRLARAVSVLIFASMCVVHHPCITDEETEVPSSAWRCPRSQSGRSSYSNPCSVLLARIPG